MPDLIVKTPKAPYYAVIFTSVRTSNDNFYALMSAEMEAEVIKQHGFLGFESARNEIGITVSYWKDLASIRRWRENAKHQIAQQNGREIWYKEYCVRICKVERDYTG